MPLPSYLMYLHKHHSAHKIAVCRLSKTNCKEVVQSNSAVAGTVDLALHTAAHLCPRLNEEGVIGQAI